MGNTAARTSYIITINTDLSYSGEGVSKDSDGKYCLTAGPGTQITFNAPSGWRFSSAGSNTSTYIKIHWLDTSGSNTSVMVEVQAESLPTSSSFLIYLGLKDQDGQPHDMPDMNVNIDVIKAITARYTESGFTYAGDITEATTTTAPTITLNGAGFVAFTINGASFPPLSDGEAPVQWDSYALRDHPEFVHPFLCNSSLAVFYDDGGKTKGSYHFVLRYTLPPDTTVYTSDDPTIVNNPVSEGGNNN